MTFLLVLETVFTWQKKTVSWELCSWRHKAFIFQVCLLDPANGEQRENERGRVIIFQPHHSLTRNLNSKNTPSSRPTERELSKQLWKISMPRKKIGHTLRCRLAFVCDEPKPKICRSVNSLFSPFKSVFLNNSKPWEFTKINSSPFFFQLSVYWHLPSDVFSFPLSHP